MAGPTATAQARSQGQPSAAAQPCQAAHDDQVRERLGRAHLCTSLEIRCCESASWNDCMEQLLSACSMG